MIPTSTGAQYFVAATGNDSTGDGSVLNPWLTLTKAFTVKGAEAGATINLRGGTYAAEGVANAKGGTSANPVTVRAFPGEPVTYNEEISLTSCNWLRLSGISLSTGPTTRELAIELYKCTNVEVSDMVVFDCYHFAIIVNADVSANSTNVQLLRNRIYNAGAGAPGSSQYHGIYLNACTSAICFGNVIYDCRAGFGIQMYQGCLSAYIVNNTVDHASQSGMIVASDVTLGSNNNSIYNNLISNCDKYAIDTFNGGAANTGNFADYNMSYNNQFNTADGFHGGGANLTYGTHQIVATNPLYQSYSTKGFALTAASPAINAGLVVAGVTDRINGSAPDIGATEVNVDLVGALPI